MGESIRLEVKGRRGAAFVINLQPGQVVFVNAAGAIENPATGDAIAPPYAIRLVPPSNENDHA